MVCKSVNRKCHLCILIVCVLLSLFPQFGCSHYSRENLIPQSENFYGRPPAAIQYSANFNVDCTAESRTGQREDLTDNMCDILNNEFYHVLKNSGFFRAISHNEQHSDFNFNIQLHYVSDARVIDYFMLGLTSFTLTLVPYSDVNGYDMNAVVTMKNGQKKSYTFSDRGEFVLWAGLALDEENTNRSSSVDKLRINMFRHLILQMEKDGFFNGLTEMAFTKMMPQ